jgi:hypothetical protein
LLGWFAPPPFKLGLAFISVVNPELGSWTASLPQADWPVDLVGGT